MAYRVCVEGARNATPAGIQKLAEAVADRFKVSSETVAKRLSAGRFTARAQVDRATAERLAAELERLGAVCVVIAEGGGAAAGPLGEAAPKPAPEPAAASQEYQSGLSAAYRTGASEERVSLGALEGVDARSSGESVRLATLDGEEEADSSESPSVSFAPPAKEPPPDRAAAAPRPPDPPSEPGSEKAWVGTDPFAPPPAGESDIELVEEVRRPKHAPPASSPPGSPAPAFSAPHAARPSGSSAHPAGGGTAQSSPAAAAGGFMERARAAAGRARAALAARPRGRFAAGLLLAIVVGFIPAHFISAARERAAYAEVDGELRATYEQLVDPEEAQVKELWQDALAEKRTARQNIAIAGSLLWLATAAGVAFLWFRKIDWD